MVTLDLQSFFNAVIDSNKIKVPHVILAKIGENAHLVAVKMFMVT